MTTTDWHSPDGTVTILIGNALTRLRELPDESVHCCVTSPPYWGLRDYGTGTWEGGSGECDHVEKRQPQNLAALADRMAPKANPRNPNRQDDDRINAVQFRQSCAKCGAVRIDQQLGLEPTPAEYVTRMVAVFREVRRVLRDDGTLWLNLGDTYASAWPCNRRNVIGNESLPNGKREARPSRMPEGLKEKDLCGIPWRVAFALQDDDWYLRQDIIWHKPNPMPESVTDRCTKAHEYLFLLSKSPRYYYDAEAIKEPVSTSTISRLSQPTLPQQAGSDRVPGKTNGRMKAVGDITTRNRRSVWTIPTKPYKHAHFATFPPALVHPCILAASPTNGTVLDPFTGSGTTLQVARLTGRLAIGIELNPVYAQLAQARSMQNLNGQRDDDRPLLSLINKTKMMTMDPEA